MSAVHAILTSLDALFDQFNSKIENVINTVGTMKSDIIDKHSALCQSTALNARFEKKKKNAEENPTLTLDSYSQILCKEKMQKSGNPQS